MPADRSNSGSFSQVHSQFAVCQVPVDSARNAFLKTNLGFPIEEGFCFGNVCPRRFNIHGRAFCNNDFRGLAQALLYQLYYMGGPHRMIAAEIYDLVSHGSQSRNYSSRDIINMRKIA